MTSTQRSESELLTALAKASTTAEQQVIVAELEAGRADRRAKAQAMEADMFAAEAVRFPVADSERFTSTAASDWLDDIEVPQTDRTAMEHKMRAEATLWLERRPEAVRADGGEFRIQAVNKARHLSNHYPGQRTAAQEAFLDQIKALAAEDWARPDDDAVTVTEADEHEEVEFEGGPEVGAIPSSADAPSIPGTPEGDSPMNSGTTNPNQGANHDNSTFSRDDGDSAVAGRKAAARFSSFEELEKHVRGLMAQHPDLVDAAEAAYNRQDQAWFDAQSTEDLKVMWEIAASSFFVGWDDEVYDALADRPGGFDSASTTGSRKTATVRECKWTYNGEDDGGNLHWWDCETHNKQEVGGPPGDEPSFPCEGWLDEVAAERAKTSSRKTAGLTFRGEEYYVGAVGRNGSPKTAQNCQNCGREVFNQEAYVTAWSDGATQKVLCRPCGDDVERGVVASRKTAARECSWTYLGDDDGGNIHWWECTTHGKEEMGGPPGDEPSFPCEGWLDESRTSSRKTANYLYVSDDGVVDEGRDLGDLVRRVVEQGYSDGYVTNQDGGRQDLSALVDKYVISSRKTAGLRPATRKEEQDWYNGYASIPGAEETEHGLMVPESYVNPDDVATCGSCGRSWDIEAYPTPASLCPFENGDERAAAPYEVKDGKRVVTGSRKTAEFRAGDKVTVDGKNLTVRKVMSGGLVEVEDEFGGFWSEQAKNLTKAASRKTAISLSNVGVESDTVGTGTDPSGKRVRFSITPAEAKQLKDILFSDLAINFSGVDVEESDIIREGVKKKVSNRRVAHNGWTNWDTWNAALWINNEEGIYRAALGTESPEALRYLVEEFGLTGDGFDPDKVNWWEVWTDSEFGPNHQGSRKTAAPTDGERSYCRICGIELQGMDYAWYALKSSSPKRDVGQHYHLPARNADWPGEFNAQGDLVPGTPGGGGGQYDAPAGTIYDAGGKPISIASRKVGSTEWVHVNAGSEGAVRDIYEKVLPGGDRLEVSVSHLFGNASWEYISRDGYLTGGSGTEATLEAAKAAAEASLPNANAGHGPATAARAADFSWLSQGGGRHPFARSPRRAQAAVGDPCWACGGKGYYSIVSYDYDPYAGDRMEVTCSTCGGSGVVNEPTDYPLADDPIFTDRWASSASAGHGPAIGSRRKTSSDTFLLCEDCTNEAWNRWKKAPISPAIPALPPGVTCSKCNRKVMSAFEFKGWREYRNVSGSRRNRPSNGKADFSWATGKDQK